MDCKENQKQKQEESDEEINNYLLRMMEGYSDSVIPPLSQFSPLHLHGVAAREEDSNDNKGTVTSSARKRRWPQVVAKQERNVPAQSMRKSRRERREKTNENYALLQSMLPNDIFPKATKENIVNGAIDYIKILEKELSELEGLKKSSELKVWSQCSNWNTTISLNVTGDVAFFGIQSFARHGLVTQIFMVFEKHRVEVLSANVAVNNGQLTVTVTTTVNGRKANNTIEKIERDILLL